MTLPLISSTHRQNSQNILTVFAVHDLEVLDGGLGDSAVEVENVRLSFVVPHWRLVVKLGQIFHPPILVSYQQAITFLHIIGTA